MWFVFEDVGVLYWDVVCEFGGCGVRAMECYFGGECGGLFLFVLLFFVYGDLVIL